MTAEQRKEYNARRKAQFEKMMKNIKARIIARKNGQK